MHNRTIYSAHGVIFISPSKPITYKLTTNDTPGPILFLHGMFLKKKIKNEKISKLFLLCVNIMGLWLFMYMTKETETETETKADSQNTALTLMRRRVHKYLLHIIMCG